MHIFKRSLSFLIPATVWAALCALWIAGYRDFYRSVLTAWGANPFEFPFLDAQGVLAFAECHRLGIDVYHYDPCDILGRIFNYSPLWLDIIPRALGTEHTIAVGVILDFLFFASLPFVLAPRTTGQTLIYAAAITSSMVVFAVERANIDLIIFVLAALAGGLYGRSAALRGCSYIVCLVAGLLKFYPLALLILTVRERLRAFSLWAAAIFAVLALFVAYYSAELAVIIPNTDQGRRFGDVFSALNLSFGLVDLFPSLMNFEPYFSWLVIGLFSSTALVIAIVLANRLRTLPVPGHWTAAQSHLTIGSIILASCFFAGPNIRYRGIFFLLTLPGLLEIGAHDPRLRRLVNITIAAILFIMWGEFLRIVVALVFLPADADYETRPLHDRLFWIGRELVWWWVVSVLGAIVLAFLLRSPALADLRSLVRRTAPVKP